MAEIQLSWQPGFSLVRKPAKRPAPRRNRQQRFEFVVEHPQKAHRARSSSSVTNTLTYSRSLSNSSRDHSIILDTHRAYFEKEAVEENVPRIDPSLGALNHKSLTRSERSLNSETVDGRPETRLKSCTSEDQSARPSPQTAAVSTLPNVPSPLFTSIPATIGYSSLTQRFKPILNRCTPFYSHIRSLKLQLKALR